MDSKVPEFRLLRGLAEPSAALFLVALVTLAVLAPFDTPDGPLSRPRLALTAQTVAMLGLAFVLVRFRVPPDPERKPSAWPAALLTGVLAGLAAFAANIVLALTLAALGVEVQEQPWVRELLEDRAALVRLLPWIVLFVPLAEEAFFRGYALRLMTRQTGSRTAILLSSLLFAVAHGNFVGIPVYVGIGVVLALVYRRTARLLAPVAAHAVHNGIALWLSLQVVG